ncbi:MAG: tetratricopeptide repeat protein [Bryobacteraceae bacterium]
MSVFLVAALLGAPAFAAEPLYDLAGQISPSERAAVTLYGAVSPFEATTLSDSSGRFHFHRLRAGAYIVAVYQPRRGEARQSAEVGPGTADAHRRVFLPLDFKETDFEFTDSVRRRHAVSTSQLAIPARALHEYAEAQKDLGRHDAGSAEKHLEESVKLAPQFASAWNNLGTIAYQTARYPRAEQCFREALAQDPTAYEPLVNLGGVLLNLNRLDEALVRNQRAVLMRPNEPLANSQLGMTYFAAGELDLAVKYLEMARHLDPAHFSHPQLTLAEIHLRRGDNAAAAAVLEDFVAHHPDYPTAARIRETIQKLRR